MAEEIGLKAVLDTSNFTKGEQTYISGIKKMGAETANQTNKINTQLGSIGKAFTGFAAGAGAVGLTAIVTGLGAGVYAGINFNNTIQQTTARLNAFTKDGKVTAQILETIRTEAAKTPFEFQEMATAAASLYPVAKQSGQGLEDLIKQAEILAASNPEQGLEGAAFALREAVSGDFVSLMERFNIPRTLINRLKDEGVPAAEITGRALQEMGLDIELVSNLGQTASGRVSTFRDSLTNLAGIVTQPFFDKGSESLGRFNQLLADNEPIINSMAEGLASRLSTSLSLYQTGIDAAIAGTESWLYVVGEVIPAIQEYNDGIVSVEAQIRQSTSSYDEYVAAIEAHNEAAGIFGQKTGPVSEALYNSLNQAVETQNRALDINAQSLRLAGQEAYYLAQQQAAAIPAIDAVTDALGRQVMASSENRRRQTEASRLTGLAGVSETTQFRATGLTGPEIQATQALPAMLKEQAKATEEAINEASKAASTAADRVKSDFESALNNLKGTIQQNIQPTLQEVWTPPEDSARIDENARRLATVSAAGFGSEWLTQLNTQFAGQDFWQPIAAAMQAGDEGALKQAANDILANNVSALWDVELIKTRVRNDLKQQQITQQIINTIAEEMAAEGDLQVEGFTGVANAISEGVKTGVDDNLDGFEEVGMSTMDGILDGMKKNEGQVLEFIKQLMADVIEDAKTEIGFGSPAKEFIPLGSSVVQGLLQGVTTNSGDFKRAVAREIDIKGTLKSANLLNKGNSRIYENFIKKGLGDLGTVTAETFNNTIGEFANRLNFPIEVIKKNAGIVQAEFTKVSNAISKIGYEIKLQNIGQAISDTLSFGAFGQSTAARLGQEINQLRVFIREGGEFTTIGDSVIVAADAQDVLNSKLEQQVQLQQELQQIAKSQAELNFLQQQLQLLDLIRQRGLNARDIFGDITFGLNASIPDLVTATSRVVQAMTSQINSQIAGTISGGTALVAGSTTSNATQNVNINVGSINNGMDMAQFTQSVQRVVAGAF